LENAPINGKNGTTGVSHSLSRQKNLSNVISSEKMRPCDFGIPPVSSDRMMFRPKPGRQHNSQAHGNNNVLMTESARVDWQTKPETSSNKWSKEDKSRPVIAAVEGGFHTQYLLFSRNDVTSASAAAKSAFLLKIQSNCCWDRIRPRILEIVSRQCRDNTIYPPLERLHVDGFLVEILPKSDRPEILPPDVQKRMMSRSLHAICIRITVDRSAVNSPLRTSLATGLSAFTKLKLKFPSEKSFQNIKSSQSSVQCEESVEPQLSASVSYDPFASKHAKTALSPLTATASVTQPTSATVTCADLERSLSQAGSSIGSVCPKSATLSLSLSGWADSSAGGSTKSSLTATGDVDSELLPRNKTECVGQPSSTFAVTPATKPPSALSSFLSADSCNSWQKLMLPGGEPKSVKLAKHDVRAAANVSRQTLKAALGSFSDRRQNLRETQARSPAEVIIVEEDDSLPPNTSSCQLRETDAGTALSSVDSSSVQLSTVVSQCLVSHSSTSDTVQSVDMHHGGISADQSVSDVTILSNAAACPGTADNSQLTAPVTSVTSLSLNIASSQPASTEQPDLMETSAVGSSSGNDSTVVEVEQVTDCQQNETVESSGNTAELSLIGFHPAQDNSTAEHLADDETAALHSPQPLINKIHVETLDADASSTVEEKDAGTCQQSDNLDCWSVASTSAEQVEGGAGALLLVDIDVPSTEQSAVNVSGHQQSHPAAVSASASLPDNTVEIVLSDDVRKVCVQIRLFCHHNFHYHGL